MLHLNKAPIEKLMNSIRMRYTLSKLSFIFLLSIQGLFYSSAMANTLSLAIAPEIPDPIPAYEKILINADSKVLKTEVTYRRIEDGPSKQDVWQRLVDFLRQKTGLDIELVLPDGQLGFERNLSMGMYDIVYVSPLQFLQAQDSQAYQAIAKRKAEPVRGLIVILDNDQARTLRDIEASALGFSSLLNFSNSVVTRASLRKLGIHPPLKLFPDSNNLLQALMNQEVRAASIAQYELDSLPPNKQESLRVLWETPGFTPYAMAVHPRVPFYSVNKIQRALASMSRRDEYSELLDQIHAVNGFEIARNSDWVDAENIRLEDLNQHLNIISP